MSKRTNFGQLKEVIQPPNLIENQVDSYKEFLQMDVAPTQRKPVGLEAVFSEVFPIESRTAAAISSMSATMSPHPASLRSKRSARGSLIPSRSM